MLCLCFWDPRTQQTLVAPRPGSHPQSLPLGRSWSSVESTDLLLKGQTVNLSSAEKDSILLLQGESSPRQYKQMGVSVPINLYLQRQAAGPQVAVCPALVSCKV